MYLTDLRYSNGRLFLERCSNGYLFAKTYDTVMILMAWQIIQQRVYDTYSGEVHKSCNWVILKMFSGI